MYICDWCGNTVDELQQSEEDFGYDTGIGWRSATQTVTNNECDCGGNFIEAKNCALCGEPYLGDKYICDYCLEINATFENAIKCGEENKYKIELNDYLASSFSVSEIEEILTRELKDAHDFMPTKIDEHASRYCLENSDALEGILLDEQKENSNA